MAPTGGGSACRGNSPRPATGAFSGRTPRADLAVPAGAFSARATPARWAARASCRSTLARPTAGSKAEDQEPSAAGGRARGGGGLGLQAPATLKSDALPPIATKPATRQDGRKVPLPDSCAATESGQCRDCGSGIQLIEQRLRFLQIERVKPFGKPAVDWSEKIASLIPLALVAPKTRHAHVGAKFQQ
jgi:hypothetical protein